MTASGTRRRLVGLALASAGLLAAGVAPALADSATYVGGAGGAFACRGPGDDTPGIGVGGACFSVPPGATTVAVTAAEDVSGPTAIRVYGHHPDQTSTGETVFCEGTGTWTIPADVDVVFVATLDPATSGCTGGGVPVKGTISASFS
jgi:hypothetical protein